MTRENRELGPEMVAEGWYVIGGDTMIWLHPPTKQVVKVDGPWPRNTYVGIPDYPGEVAGAPDEIVYHVSRSEHDDNGEPIIEDRAYDGFLTTSYALAVKVARETRQRILSGKKRPTLTGKQVTFDDLLEHGNAGAK